MAWLLPLARYVSRKLVILATGHLRVWLAARPADDLVWRFLQYNSAQLRRSAVLPWIKPTHRSSGCWKSIRVSLRCRDEVINHADLQQLLTDSWNSGCNLNFREGCLLCNSSLVLFMIETDWSFISVFGRRWSNCTILAALWQLLTRMLGLETSMNQLVSQKNSENWLSATLPGNGTKIVTLLQSLPLCWNALKSSG